MNERGKWLGMWEFGLWAMESHGRLLSWEVGVEGAHSDKPGWFSAPTSPSQDVHSFDQEKAVHLPSTVRLKQRLNDMSPW